MSQAGRRWPAQAHDGDLLRALFQAPVAVPAVPERREQSDRQERGHHLRGGDSSALIATPHPASAVTRRCPLIRRHGESIARTGRGTAEPARAARRSPCPRSRGTSPAAHRYLRPARSSSSSTRSYPVLLSTRKIALSGPPARHTTSTVRSFGRTVAARFGLRVLDLGDRSCAHRSRELRTGGMPERIR